jgi:uncharacterized protein YjbI with pentapeptide repeats
MANKKQLKILKQGVHVWNAWREENPSIRIDLHQANLKKADLRGANLSGADLIKANLIQANLSKAKLFAANISFADLSFADLSRADLRKAYLASANLNEVNLNSANLREAFLINAYLTKSKLVKAKLGKALLVSAHLNQTDLRGAVLKGAFLNDASLSEANLNVADLSNAQLISADLSFARLKYANLTGANLGKADLTGADLNKAKIVNANLEGAQLVGTYVHDATISGSLIYSINVWDLIGDFAEQKDLVITSSGEPLITVDNIKVAQFLYLILNNEEIRDVINTLTSKAVLILGRFTIPERKAILDALKNKLREYDLLPIVFDFDSPTDKDFTETIKTLAGLSYFVIADITNPKSSPLELQATVPDYQIPFVPIIQEGEQPFAMMVDLQKKYNWVLDTLSYNSIETLIQALKPGIIDPAIQKHNELRLIKAREPKIRSANDFIDDKGLDNQLT